MTNEQVNELLNLGWDFGSHTINHYRLPTLTDAEIDFELRESKRVIEETRGIQCDYIVYPNGENDERVRKIAQKYYKFGIATGGSLTTYPVKTYQINRISMGSNFDGVEKNTLEYYKSMFDKAYANDLWIIFMLHSAAAEFDVIQQQYLVELIDYIQTFADVPILPINKAYKEYGNMLVVGDGTVEKMVITNAGDIIENEALYSKEIENNTKAFKTGTGINQPTPVDFIEASPVKIEIKATEEMANPSILSVGKNIWGGLKFANDIIKAVNNPSYAYYTEIDGRRVLALVGNSAILIPLLNKGFIDGTQYVISLQWRRADGATGGGGRFTFKYKDGTSTNGSSPTTTEWSFYQFGSVAGKSIESINGNYGSFGQITYIDIDTMQLEIGSYATTYEKYKESKLDIATNLQANDILTFENNKLFKNAEEVQFVNDLKAYKNGLIYLSDNSNPVIKIVYPRNRKAVDNIYKGIN